MKIRKDNGGNFYVDVDREYIGITNVGILISQLESTSASQILSDGTSFFITDEYLLACIYITNDEAITEIPKPKEKTNED